MQPTLRNTHHHKASDTGGDVSEELPIDRFDFSYHAAAEWLKAAKALFDTAADPWLRQFLAFYRTGLSPPMALELTRASK